MLRVAPTGVLLGTLASILVLGCSDNAPTAESDTSAQPSFAVTSTNSCDPKTRPGKIVD